MPPNLKLKYGMTPTAWDALCLRCGACCILSDGRPCGHLMYRDDGTTRCLIYVHVKGKWMTGTGIQLRTGEHCLPIEYATRRGPACPYSKFFKTNKLLDAAKLAQILQSKTPFYTPAQVRRLKRGDIKLTHEIKMKAI